MKILAKIILIVLILFIGFCLFWVLPRYSVPVLTYHSFDYGKGLLSVSPDNFEKQMHYLKDKGFKVVSLGDFVEGVKNRKKFAHNTVVITVDDGYENNFTYAYPVLKKFGFPATIFLITNNIGTDENFLTWEEIKEMSKNHISFGGHTRSHPYLPSVEKKDVLWNEILGSKNAIEEHIGIPADYFCYPLGGFTEQAEMLVRRAGYKGACATNRGDHSMDPFNVYEIRRISMRNGDPYFSFSNLYAPISFRAKLSGYYNIFRSKKKGY